MTQNTVLIFSYINQCLCIRWSPCKVLNALVSMSDFNSVMSMCKVNVYIDQSKKKKIYIYIYIFQGKCQISASNRRQIFVTGLLKKLVLVLSRT